MLVSWAATAGRSLLCKLATTWLGKGVNERKEERCNGCNRDGDGEDGEETGIVTCFLAGSCWDAEKRSGAQWVGSRLAPLFSTRCSAKLLCNSELCLTSTRYATIQHARHGHALMLSFALLGDVPSFMQISPMAHQRRGCSPCPHHRRRYHNYSLDGSFTVSAPSVQQDLSSPPVLPALVGPRNLRQLRPGVLTVRVAVELN
jgi:hypothetical protein